MNNMFQNMFQQFGQNMMQQNPQFSQFMPQQNFSQSPAQQTQQPQVPQMNLDQFRQFAPRLDQSILDQLVQQARQRGISEQNIQEGLDFINGLKK